MLKQINFYLEKKELLLLFFLLFFIVISTFLEIISIGTIPILVSLIIQPQETLNFVPNIKEFLNQSQLRDNIIIIFSIILILIFILKNFFLFFVHFFQASFFKNLRIKKSEKILNFYFNQSYSYFLYKDPAIMLRTLTSDLDLANIYILAILNLLREAIIISLIIAVLSYINFKISLPIIIGLSFFSYIIYSFFKKKLSNLAKINYKERGEQVKIINQIFYNIQDIKILLKENFFFSQYNTSLIKLKNTEFFNDIFLKAPRLIFEIIAVTSAAVIVIFFVLMNIDLEKSLVFFSFFVMCCIRLIPSANLIIQSLTLIRKSEVSFNYILKEFNFENLSFSKIKKNFFFKSKKIKFRDLKIENLSFSYIKNNKKVLNNINLKISNKTSIGIIGKTGSGKSTLLRLMLGLLEPSEGNVYFNQKELKKNIIQWYRNIGYVPQAVFLKDDTIKNNIALGLESKNINNKFIWETLKLSGLDKFVKGLPNGVDTFVGAHGIRLSGGQIQRIGIARALYNKPQILFLDEATSSLDQITEKNILKDFNNLKKEKCIIMVSHRLSSLKDCDNVFYLKKGQIVDNGRINYLIKRNPELNK